MRSVVIFVLWLAMLIAVAITASAPEAINVTCHPELGERCPCRPDLGERCPCRPENGERCPR